MIKVLLLFCTILCSSKFITNKDAHLLNGAELTIEHFNENDQVNQKTVGPIEVGKLLGNGGAKSAFDLKNGYVLLLPNVGKTMWERMVNEEFTMDKLYRKYIKTSSVEKATFDYEGTTNYALYSKNFAQYQQEEAFIIDSKQFNVKDATNFRDQIPEKDEKAWVAMLMPVVEQYTKMKQDKVHVPFGDALSFLFAANGSQHNVNLKKGPSVSIFGFDFTSKVETADFFEDSNFVSTSEDLSLQNMLKDVMVDLLLAKANDDSHFYNFEFMSAEDQTFIKNVYEQFRVLHPGSFPPFMTDWKERQAFEKKIYARKKQPTVNLVNQQNLDNQQRQVHVNDIRQNKKLNDVLQQRQELVDMIKQQQIRMQKLNDHNKQKTTTIVNDPKFRRSATATDPSLSRFATTDNTRKLPNSGHKSVAAAAALIAMLLFI